MEFFPNYIDLAVTLSVFVKNGVIYANINGFHGAMSHNYALRAIFRRPSVIMWHIEISNIFNVYAI